jgi:hypothetical protein
MSRQVFKLNSDVVGLVDEWGRGFVNELDYRLEARRLKLPIYNMYFSMIIRVTYALRLNYFVLWNSLNHLEL